MTTIAAVQSAFPAYRYPQAKFAQKVADQVGLDPAQRARLERLYGNAGVNTRHTILPMAEYGALGGIGPANDRYIEEATDIGEQALRGALDAAGLAARDVDLLIVTSVTGVAVPSLDARLIPRLGLRPDVKRLPIFGLGCVAGAAGLGRLHDYLLAWPQHTAALLAVELCSLTWRPTDVTVADLVASSLFGDGAVALVATGGRALDGRAAGGPQVVASRSQVFPDSADTLGWRLASDGFRIILTAELADVVERQLSGSVTAFLAEHGLTVERGQQLGVPSGWPEDHRRHPAQPQAARQRSGDQSALTRGGREHVLGVSAAHPGEDHRHLPAARRFGRPDDRAGPWAQRRAGAAAVVTGRPSGGIRWISTTRCSSSSPSSGRRPGQAWPGGPRGG